MSAERHVVTGATGLVGAALVLELLDKTAGNVVCLVRPDRRATAAQRLTTALTGAARHYGLGDTMDHEIAARCRAVPADLSEGFGATAPASIGRASEFWHCAADLRYEERHRGLLHSTNVVGTERAYDLATTLGVGSFNYVSTAYVAGRRNGTLLEDEAPRGNDNNAYEESKTEAERLLSTKRGPQIRVLRPSIVIGHSRTMAVAGGRTGLYTIHRRVFQLDRMFSLLTDVEGRLRPLRIRADADSRINVVPVDLVAADAVALSRNHAPAGVYHLTHPTPMRLGPGLALMFRLSGLVPPELVTSSDGFEQIDREFDRRLDFHRSYMTGHKVFDQTRLRRALPGSALTSWAVDLSFLERLYRWHLEQLSGAATVRTAAR